jgi:hypothetical protein
MTRELVRKGFLTAPRAIEQAAAVDELQQAC